MAPNRERAEFLARRGRVVEFGRWVESWRDPVFLVDRVADGSELPGNRGGDFHAGRSPGGDSVRGAPEEPGRPDYDTQGSAGTSDERQRGIDGGQQGGPEQDEPPTLVSIWRLIRNAIIPQSKTNAEDIARLAERVAEMEQSLQALQEEVNLVSLGDDD